MKQMYVASFLLSPANHTNLTYANMYKIERIKKQSKQHSSISYGPQTNEACQAASDKTKDHNKIHL